MLLNQVTKCVAAGALALGMAVALSPRLPAQISSSPTRGSSSPAGLLYLDSSLPVDQRVDDLVSRMTMEEKASQLVNQARAIPRLQVPAYDYWSEALHGVANTGAATVFPQAIALASTWDTTLLHEVATVIGTEGRAKHHEAIRQGRRDIFEGLTFWSPNINIFRDPRWGRGQETYGEDPFLTARMGIAFVTGLQGDNPRYLRVVSTPKHFAVHSGPEPTRHKADVSVSKHDEEDTYLPAFRATLVEGHAASTMCAYNSINGEPACANKFLLHDQLRGAWRFNGFVVSDCGAVIDIFEGHRFAKSREEAAADSLKMGMDNECVDDVKKIPDNSDYVKYINAVKQGLLAEKDMDYALRRLFRARFLLGMFDPPEMVPYAQIPFSENDSEAHRQLALKTAQETMVLLKNDGILPLLQAPKSIAVIGPLADNHRVLEGNYSGSPSRSTSALEGIRKQFAASTVTFVAGTHFLRKPEDDTAKTPLDDAVAAARKADLVVAVVGITSDLEGEEMKVQIEGFSGGDRTSLDLPREEEALLEAVKATGKPLIVVLMNGSALSVNWAGEHANAILEAWYPGEEGGTAIAETLAGVNNPAGRLPVTFYTGVSQLPPFEDYSMKDRTYRYFTGKPLYPFGYGLSFSSFAYSNVKLSSNGTDMRALAAGEPLTVEADVKNTSQREGDEVAEAYLTFPKLPGAPVRALRSFTRLHIASGETRHIRFQLDPRQLSMVNPTGDRIIAPGSYTLTVGGGQPGTDASLAETTFTITGQAQLPE